MDVFYHHYDDARTFPTRTPHGASRRISARSHLTVETAHPRIVLVSTIKSVVSTPGSQRDNYSS